MSEKAQPLLDLYRMAQTRRGMRGKSSVVDFPRLRGLLSSDSGMVAWTLDFGVDELGAPYCDVSASGSVCLQCQRTLTDFAYLVEINNRLSLVDADDDGTQLRHEPLIVEAAGKHALEIVEDELILAIPLVPVAPSSEPLGPATYVAEPVEKPNPFSVLKHLKSSV